MSKKGIIIILVMVTIGAVFAGILKFVHYNVEQDINQIQEKENKEIKVGLKFPDFVLKTPDGKKVSIKDYRGKIVLLNFWSSWCIYCDKEMPDLQELYNANKEDFVVLAVNLGDDKSTIEKYVKSNGYNFPVLIDEEGSTGEKYKISGLPTSFFIDKEGNLLGFTDSSGTTIDRVTGMMTRDQMFSMLEDIKNNIKKQPEWFLIHWWGEKMIKIYHSKENQILETIDDINDIPKGSWVSLIAPTEEELTDVINVLKIAPDFIKDPLDSEEKARIEVEDGQTLIIVDIPIVDVDSESIIYETIPIGIIVTEDHIVTICLKKNPIIRDFENNIIKTFYTFKRTRFVFQIQFRIATYYLRYLNQINKQTDKIEDNLHKSMKNQELFSLLNYQKSLVYFTTSLKSNHTVLQKLMKGNSLRMYEADEDILEDVIIENRQAIEMADTYLSIIGSMTEAFASVISNNLNNVMKVLTSITLVLSFPIMVASIYGMNIALPLQNNPNAFPIIITITLIFSSFMAYVFAKMKWF